MQRKISAGIVLFAVFLPVKAWCAQQDSNLQPLAPEAVHVTQTGVNLHEIEASKNASKVSAGFVIPAALFVTLQGLDVHSTWQARSSGYGVEGNPWMDVSTGKQIAIKAAVSTGIVFIAGKMHRRHPKLAKVVLYVASAAVAGVVYNNYQIAQGRRR